MKTFSEVAADMGTLALLEKVENLYNPCVGTLEISSKNFLVPTFHILALLF